jgi:hypothetical protein
VTVQVDYEPAMPGEPQRVAVRVNRASNGAPVVSGTLRLSRALAPIAGATVEASGVGTWLITLPATEVGYSWQDLQLNFTDGFQYYAPLVHVFSLDSEVPPPPVEE